MKNPCTLAIVRWLRVASFAGCASLTAGCGDTDAKPETETETSDDPVEEAPPTFGDPITAPDNEWTWVPIDGANCRDGSQAGVVVNPNAASTELMIFLEGGGACFNGITCMQNPAHFDDSRLAGFVDSGGPSGILDRENEENPAADWNYVFVPYCTGDVFAGREPDGEVAGDAQLFVGYANFELFLKRIVPTFGDVEHVLLTGVSAGGFGASVNYHQTARYFAPTPVDLLDDSGPAMRGKHLQPCLQDLWRTLWKLDETVLASCGSDCPNESDFLMDYIRWMSTKYATRQFGLIESMEDNVISMFFGFGENECQSFLPFSGEEFAAALTDSRIELKELPNFSTFFFPGSGHTTLMGNGFYTRTTGDGSSRLVTWVRDWLDGEVSHVGP